MNEESVYTTWYEHNCDWITKYCDQHHLVSAIVPKSVLQAYVVDSAPSEE